MTVNADPTHPFVHRSAVVSGAGRGIGKAVAIALANAGATVGVLARSQAEIDAVALTIRESGGAAYAINVDMADQQGVVIATQRILEQAGTVDILINNAGVVGPLGSTADVPFAEWVAALTINLIGAAQLTQGLLPTMLQQGWGRVVSVLSGTMGTMCAMVGANAYATSKSALEVFTLNLANELTDSGVTVNAYRPGPVDTAMQAEVRNQDPERIGSAASLQTRFVHSYESGRLITPQESAKVLLARLCTEGHGEVWSFRD
jgi:3-oxoacyl-[acyl-carrier protein] reductase